MSYLGGLVWEIVSNAVVQYSGPWLSDFVSEKIRPLWQRYWPVLFQTVLVPLYHLALAILSPLLHDDLCIHGDSDSVWENFLPSDYRQIISRSVSPVAFSTKKQLYLSLCDSPLLLDGGNLSFGLDRDSGKKCFTLPARQLLISWKENTEHWNWISLPESRFSEVAQLLSVWWLDILGRINTEKLSSNTTYAAYLIFQTKDHFGLESLLVKSSVRFVNELDESYPDDMSSTVFLTLEDPPREQIGRLPQMRGDGWMEVELGEFYNCEGDEGEVEMRLREVDVENWKRGLIVEGIEVRPKEIRNA